MTRSRTEGKTFRFAFLSLSISVSSRNSYLASFDGMEREDRGISSTRKGLFGSSCRRSFEERRELSQGAAPLRFCNTAFKSSLPLPHRT